MIAPSTSASTLTPSSPRTCMRRLSASRTYDQWSWSFWNPRRPTISGGATSCFSHFVAMPSTTISSQTSPIRPSIELDWTTTWWLGSSAPSPLSSTRLFGSRRRPHARRGLRLRLNSSTRASRVFYNSMPGSTPSSKETLALTTTIVGWSAWPTTFMPWVRLSPIVTLFLIFYRAWTRGLITWGSSSSGHSRSPPSTPSAMTSNSRRLSWTTRRPKDRPPRSTPCPRVEGALRRSSCLRVHHSRNHHVLSGPSPSDLQPQHRRQRQGQG
jgi:hypothetical protein